MTRKPKNKNSINNKLMMFAGIIVVAVVVAVIVIVMSSQSSFSSGAIDYAEIPQERLEDGGFVIGNPDAPVTIVAFEDFLCPHCQRYTAITEQFLKQYVAPGLARFEYRFFPAVDPVFSELSAKFAECADILEPGSFWNAHDVMYELASATRFNKSTPRVFAERMEIPYADLLECSNTANQVATDSQLGQQLGVSGTPTIMVRYGDNEPQAISFGTQPTLEQLGIVVETGG